MATIDQQLVRHALSVAQAHGFAEVEISVADASFRAILQRAPKKPADHALPQRGAVLAEEPATDLKLIKSAIVGYYRLGSTPLEIGRRVAEGDVVAVVNALGIANDLESPVGGEIVEVLVQDGQAVQYGQVLAKVKP